MKPKSFNKVDGGRATARVVHVEPETNADRDQKTRMQVASWVCPDMPGKTLDERKQQVKEWAETDDATEALKFVALILAVMGLDGKTTSPPSSVPLVWPDGGKGPGARPKTATQFPDPPRSVGRRRITEHGTPQGYRSGCHCEYCVKAITVDGNHRGKGRAAAVKAVRTEYLRAFVAGATDLTAHEVTE